MAGMNNQKSEVGSNKKSLDANSNTKDDLKTLPMSEFQTKLASSPEGLTQEEAKKRLDKYGPNEIDRKENKSVSEISYHISGVLFHG